MTVQEEKIEYRVCHNKDGTFYKDASENYTCACLETSDKVMRLAAMVLGGLITGYAVSVLRAPFKKNSTIGSTEPTSTAQEKKDRCAKRGQAASMASTLMFSSSNGLIDAVANVNSSTSTALIGMLCGGTYGFIMDNAMGSDTGFEMWNRGDVGGAIRYGLGTLGTGMYDRYLVTIAFDMFISMIVYKPLFETIHELPYFRRSLPFKTNFMCSGLVGTLTFMLYANMTRFQWAYPSTTDEHENELIGTPEMMLSTSVAAALFLSANTVTDERLKWVRDLEQKLKLKQQVDGMSKNSTLSDMTMNHKHFKGGRKSFSQNVKHFLQNFEFDVNKPAIKLILVLGLMGYAEFLKQVWGKSLRSRVDHVVVPDNIMIGGLTLGKNTPTGTVVEPRDIYEKNADGVWVPTTSTVNYKVKEFIIEDNGYNVYRLYKEVPTFKYSPDITEDAAKHTGNKTKKDIMDKSLVGYVKLMGVATVAGFLTIMGTSSMEPVPRAGVFVLFLLLITFLVLPGLIPSLPAYRFWGYGFLAVVVLSVIIKLIMLKRNKQLMGTLEAMNPIKLPIKLVWPGTAACEEWFESKGGKDQKMDSKGDIAVQVSEGLFTDGNQSLNSQEMQDSAEFR